jgi:hypothetical protein
MKYIITETQYNILMEQNGLSYEEMYDLIVLYIKNTMKAKEQIHEWVPNYHIAQKFRDVLIHLELEHMYPDEFKSVEVLEILNNLNKDNYFSKELLKKNGTDEIYRVYEKLREKRDIIRNIMILAGIELRDVVMPHKSKEDLKSHKIRIKTK